MDNQQTPGLAIPSEIIIRRIVYIRNQKVMLDSDLAELYGVETKRLKEQVKRNIERFPERYMFMLTQKARRNLKYLPFAFTEHGVMMLANVLKSKRATEVSMKIIDVFITLREHILSNAELREEIEEIKQKATNQKKYRTRFSVSG